MLALLTFPVSATAYACATCNAGDPTLQIVGMEQPIEGRFRMGAVVSHQSISDDDAQTFDQRINLGATWAFGDAAVLALSLPVVWREVRYATLAEDHTLGLGDADVRARVTLFRDRNFAPAHRLLIDIGSRLPTGMVLGDAQGLLPLQAQPGTGAFEPYLGVLWISNVEEFSLWGQANVAFPFTGTDGWRNGIALRGSAAAQWQPLPEFALRVLVDSRFEGASGRITETLPNEINTALFVGGGVVIAPATDWVMHLVMRAPVFSAYPSHPAHREGFNVEAGVALDV